MSKYPKDSNRFLVEREYNSLLLTGKITEDDLVQCAKNYAESCRIEGTKYFYNAENFLGKMVFEQYLPGKYEKPTQKKINNSFNSFPQREYDFDKLEKHFINHSHGGNVYEKY